MIFYLIFLTVVPQFCEMIYDLYKANVIITQIDISLFKAETRQFQGINRRIHEELCTILGAARVIPFEPLPIDREYFKVLVEVNENHPAPDDPSSSQSENMASSSQPSSSQHPQLTLANFLDESHPSRTTNRRTVVDKISFGENKRSVSAISCKFNNFRLFMVPVELFSGYILLLDTGKDSKHIPLGITLKRLRLGQVETIDQSRILFQDMLKKLQTGEAEKKVPVLFSLMEGINQPEIRKLKNIQLCSAVFTSDNTKFYDDEKILAARMTYVISPEIDSLMCHVTMFDTYRIYENPFEDRHIFVDHHIFFHQEKIGYFLAMLPGIGTIDL